MLRKIFLLLTFAMFLEYSFGQYYSLSMGLNLATQERDKYPINNDQLFVMLGFNSQFGYDLKFWKSIYLSTEIGFSQAGIQYRFSKYFESFNYLSILESIKLRSSIVPVYFAIGGYGALLVSASEGDEETSQSITLNAFKLYDYGVVPTIGIHYEFSFFMYFAELRFRYGMNNIYRLSGNEIYNRIFSISAGVSFILH